MPKRINLKLLERIFRKVWTKNTCYPPSQTKWSSLNSALGQCAITALIIQDYFGGDILYDKDYDHYWNKLPNCKEIDLTRSQFPKKNSPFNPEIVSREFILKRKSAKRAKTKARYFLLKKRITNYINKNKNLKTM